jgi:hypothetical protein
MNSYDAEKTVYLHNNQDHLHLLNNCFLKMLCSSQKGLLFLLIFLEILSCSTANVHNNAANFKPIITSAIPSGAKIPTFPPSTFPSLIDTLVTDIPSIQSRIPQSLSPAKITLDMTLSPSENFNDNFPSSPSQVAMPIVPSQTEPSIWPTTSNFDMTYFPNLELSGNVTTVPSEVSLLTSSPSSSYATYAPTTNGTSATSYAPIGITQVNVTVVFKGVEDYFSKEELTLLSRETWRYLSMEDIHVEQISILSQSSINSIRILERSLVVVLEVEGHSSSDDFSNQLQNLLVDNFSDYRNFLVDSLPILKPSETGSTTIPTRSPTIVKEQNELISKPNEPVVNWWLVGSAIILSIIAIIVLLFIIRSRYNRKRQSRTFPLVQTSVAVSVRCI